MVYVLICAYGVYKAFKKYDNIIRWGIEYRVYMLRCILKSTTRYILFCLFN